jgi:signal transduction histidine kinase
LRGRRGGSARRPRLTAPRVRRAQILTDEMRVRQIVMNGLTNAVKYSNAPENGPIRVVVGASVDAVALEFALLDNTPGASQPQQWVYFDVLDRGAGLGGTNEAILFTDFAAPTSVTSIHSTHTRESMHGSSSDVHVGSSGVGLPICSRCVRALSPSLDPCQQCRLYFAPSRVFAPVPFESCATCSCCARGGT